jgi:hypothetical protein
MVYHQEEDSSKYWMKKLSNKKSTAYLASNISIEVAENVANPKEYWGRKLYPPYYAMTLVMENTGTTGVQALLQGIGKGDVLKNIPRTKEKQAAALTRELASKPLTYVSTDWRVQPYDKEKELTLFTIKGMTRFPKNSDGTYNPEYDHKEFGVHMAQNYVVRFNDPRTYKAKGVAGVTKATEKQDTAPVSTLPAGRPQPKQHTGHPTGQPAGAGVATGGTK